MFEQLKKRLSDHNGQLSFQNKLISGFNTGIMEGTLITTPTERIKVLQQNQLHNNNLNTKSGGLKIRKIVIENGILTLWKGLGPTVTRQCVNTGARLSIYDSVKSVVEKIVVPYGLEKQVGIISGASVGFIGSFITQPIDVVKSYTQANNDGVWKNIKTINRLGIVGFLED